jgi:hypothetical protein
MNGQDLGSFVKEVERLVTQASRTATMAVAGEKAGTYYLIGPDGKAERRVVDPPWADFKPETPAELKRFIENHRTGDAQAVFYNDDRVTFVFDENDRRDKATCELATTPPFDWLTTASTNPPILRQADFVRLLRITLRGCLPDGNLLALVRQLKFNTAGEAAGSIQHGRESMAKSITATITGEAALPEEVGLFVQVFENHPYRAQVICALETHPNEQAFRLTPYPLEVRRAMDEALDDIADLYRGDDMPPVYRGQPA